MKKTNTKRFISSIIIAMMVLTTLVVPVAATGNGAAEMSSYQSSTNFSTTSGDGTWGTDNVWSSTLIDLSGSSAAYSTVTNVSGEQFISEHGTYVDADEIAPVTGDANANDFAKYGGAKTFTAPYSGAITISYASMKHPAENVTAAVVKHAWNQGMKFRVTKQSAGCVASKIYPAASDYTESVASKGAFDLVASDTTHTIIVSKGDKIHFEVMRMNNGNPWQGIYCDPIITYTELIDENETRNEFKSSDNFSTANDDATWDKGIWSAEWKDCTDGYKYKLMNQKGDGVYTGGKNLAISGTIIQPSSANAANILDHTSVLTFTAPKSGKISIGYTTETLRLNWNNGIADFAITKRNVGSTAVATIVPVTKVKGSADTAAPTASVYVAKGDKISFEVKADDSFTGGSNGTTSGPGKGDCYAVLPCTPIITYDMVIPEIEDRLTFKSSEYFDTSSGDGTWDGGVWSANLLDTTTGEYTAMTANGSSWVSGTSSVDADEIMAVCGNNIGDTYLTLSAVKTFTAPKDGRVQISYAEKSFERDGITHTGGVLKYTFNQGVKFRVRHQSGESISKIYPADAEYIEKQMNASDLYMIGANTVTNTIEVKAGDKIHFEQMRLVPNNPWQGIYCDPIIEYMLAPADRNTFRSAEYYDTTGETAKWDSGVWQAWFYDWNNETATTERDKYQLMRGIREDDGIVKWTNNEKSEAGDYNWNSRAAWIGPEIMRVEMVPFINNDAPATDDEKTWSEEIKGYPIGRDYPVKVFKAPKTGVVSIGAHVMAAPGADKGVRVRIMKMNATSGEPVQVWPEKGFKTYAAGEAINFAPVTTALAEGDMLMFECAYIYGTGFTSPYSGTINWDPTVTYTDGVAINNIGTEFKSGEDIVTGVANIATAANLTATIPVYSGTAFDNAIVVVGIYDSSNMLVRVGMSEGIAISATEPNNVSVAFGAAANEIEGGSIKVFLWESLGSLAPLAVAMPIQ